MKKSNKSEKAEDKKQSDEDSKKQMTDAELINALMIKLKCKSKTDLARHLCVAK